MRYPQNLVDDPELRERTGVFADRTDAGTRLARLLTTVPEATDSLLLAIPAGGVPVALAVASELSLPLDLVVVSKITLPWNTEAGYGAVAFNGAVQLNEELLCHLGLSTEEVAHGVARTREKVDRRCRSLRGDRPLPELSSRPVVLIDDGLASGFTMMVAVEAVRGAGADPVVVAIPTAHTSSVRRVARIADQVVCLNLRGGHSFAVASAYRQWSDVSEEEVASMLAGRQR